MAPRITFLDILATIAFAGFFVAHWVFGFDNAIVRWVVVGTGVAYLAWYLRRRSPYRRRGDAALHR